MDFFAVAGAPYNQVYRLKIEQHLQGDLERKFNDHSKALMDLALEVVPFEGGNFTPDETEVLEISPFDLPASVYDPIQDVLACPTLPRENEVISCVNCVFGYDSANDRLIFQVLPKQQRLSTDSIWAMFLSKDTFKRLEDPGLILGTGCHAVHENGGLRFKSLWWAKQIFDLSNFYRGATDADVESFASHQSVIVDDVNQLKANSGQWARTRIAFILGSGVLDKCKPEQLVSEAKRFNVPLQLEQVGADQKLRIPSDRKDLRAVLKFLEEELYIGVITGDAYETNSKRKRTN